MYKFQLYIGEDLVELFKDETISLNSSVQNIRDISKVFTDFTQSFTVPASQINNKLFTHWYNVDITGGFTAHTRASSTIELNSLPFRSGLVRLESVQMKNNKPFNYKITFYGDLVSLTDLIGEDQISLLDFESLNHVQSFDNVIKGITTNTLNNGDVIYPLISTDVLWSWGGLGSTDIKRDASNTNAIEYDSLKPAIKVIDIINAIQTKYNITFSNDFFGLSHFQNLWMWCNNSKEKLDTKSNGTILLLDLDTVSGLGWSAATNDYTAQTVNDDTFTVIMDIPARYQSVEYTIYLYVNGVLDSFQTSIGDDTLIFATGVMSIGDKVTFGISYGHEFQRYQINISRTFPVLPANSADTNSEFGAVFINNALPDISVIDFLNGIFQMFNLTIIANSDTDFFIDTLDSWYQAGTVYDDIDKYISIDNVDIRNPNLDKVINYTYQESDTLLAEKFREISNGIGYGDLKAEFTFDGGTMDIELPFENLQWTRLLDSSGVNSDLHVAFCVDNEYKAILPKPILFYNRGLGTSSDQFQIKDENAIIDLQNKFHNIGQEDNVVTGSTNISLNWGSEISTWNLEVQSASLFSANWSDYIGDLYDLKRRIFNFKAKFPLNIITRLKLNDILIIKERAYIINNMNINFTTGETKLELLNFIGEITGTAVNKFFEYDLNVQV